MQRPINSISVFFTMLSSLLAVSLVRGEDPELTSEQLFDSTKIVEVDIKLAEAEWHKIRKHTRSIVEALGKTHPESPFEYVKGDVTINGVEIKDVGIRKKGFIGSLDDERPSLKINFSEYKEQNPVAGLDRLTLNNNKQDPSRLSQYLSYKLFNESGTVAPRCSFAKVTVNGKYLGIYSNVESIKAPFLKRNFGDGDGALYEGTVADFYVDTIEKFEFKNEQANREDLLRVAQAFDADELDLKQIDTLVDINAFVRFWAMESLIGFWDGYGNNQNNYFVYKNPANSKMYFIPWGTDSSFSKSMPLPPYRVKVKSVHCQAVIANKLFREPEIEKLYHETLTGFLEKNWDEAKLLAEIDRVEAMLKDSLLESNTGFAKSVDKMRDFIETRRKLIGKELAKWPVDLKQLSRRPSYFKEIGKATASFSTEWYDRTPKKGTEVGNVKIEMTLNGEKVEFEQVGSYSETSKWPSPEKIKPPTVVIVGKRASDGKTLTLGIGMANDDFHPGAKAIDVLGIYIEGTDFGGPGGFKIISGTATFDEAEMKKGAPVKGTMDLTIVQMAGGKPIKKKSSKE